MYLLDIKSMLTIQSQQEPSGHNRNHPVTTGTIWSQQEPSGHNDYIIQMVLNSFTIV